MLKISNSNLAANNRASQGPWTCRPLLAQAQSSPKSRYRPGSLGSSVIEPKRQVVAAAGKDVSTTPWAGPPERTPPTSTSPTPAPLRPLPGEGPSLDISTGLAALIALNGAIFAGAALANLPPVAALALYNSNGTWWQCVTSAFAHANFAHLSRNMFLVWLWGSVLRREVTGPGVWFTYVLCAVGSNLAATYALGTKAKAMGALLGIGASGGCAGVALAALILTARPSLRWLLGAALAVQFTLPALLTAPVPYNPAVAGGAAAAGQAALSRLLPTWFGEQLGVAGAGVGVGAGAGGAASGLGGFLAALKAPAMSWLWGAAAGALLVVILARLPEPK